MPRGIGYGRKRRVRSRVTRSGGFRRRGGRARKRGRRSTSRAPRPGRVGYRL